MKSSAFVGTGEPEYQSNKPGKWLLYELKSLGSCGYKLLKHKASGAICMYLPSKNYIVALDAGKASYLIPGDGWSDALRETLLDSFEPLPEMTIVKLMA